MELVNKKAQKDEDCKKMFEKLASKSTDEVKTILRWEFEKLVMRGATGIGVTKMCDFYPLPRTEEDKKQTMMDMIVFSSMMNKEDCTSEVSVQWSWEE
jgi:hypothetical protein